MINQIYQILTFYKYIKESGTPDEQTLMQNSIKAANKWLVDYLAGKFDDTEA